MDQFCFGVDLGGTTVKIGLFTVDGMLRRNGRFRQEQRIRALLFSVILQRPYRIRWMYVI